VDHAGAAAKEEARLGRRERVQLGDEIEITVTVSSDASPPMVAAVEGLRGHIAVSRQTGSSRVRLNAS
jgi:hypothetical protein